MKKTKLKIGDVIMDKSNDMGIVYGFPTWFPKYAKVRYKWGVIYMLKRNLIRIGEL